MKNVSTWGANSILSVYGGAPPWGYPRAVDLLNQMDGLYVTKTEFKNQTIVKLIIEEEDPRDVIEGEISSPGDQ